MKKSLMLVVLAVAILLMGVVSYAVAAPATATDSVTVTAHIDPRITLTLDTNTIDFGTVAPGVAVTPQAVHLTVKSNKAYDLAVAKSGQVALMGLSTDLADSSGNAKTASQGYTDNYSLSVPWTTDPNDYTATVQYTVTQN